MVHSDPSGEGYSFVVRNATNRAMIEEHLDCPYEDLIRICRGYGFDDSQIMEELKISEEYNELFNSILRDMEKLREE